MTELIKRCPKCGTERPLTEVLCGYHDNEGASCGFSLMGVRATQAGAIEGEPEDESTLQLDEKRIQDNRKCPNGHDVDLGDLICSACGAAIELDESDILEEECAEILLQRWRVVDEQTPFAGGERRVHVRATDTSQEAVLTIYREGAEPDPGVYEVLRAMDADHIAKLYETGRIGERFYELTEYIGGGNLADLVVDPEDLPTFRRIVDEIARALEDFRKVGLRHRDLSPRAITIRTQDPLDLVIEGFGSACLSEFDLDIIAPLENTVYMAPETVAGGVALQSDWWSLGMILLEKATAGGFFAGVNPQAFIIEIMTRGVSLPADLDRSLVNLLNGLLIRDRDRRFGIEEVRAWLNGELVPLPVEVEESDEKGETITLGEVDIGSVTNYALEAAKSKNWDAAKEQFLTGRLATWAEEAGLNALSVHKLKSLSRRPFDDDFRLGIALKILNENIPFVQRGEIVNPAWLLENPDRGYELIVGEAMEAFSHFQMEPWLQQLRKRADLVRRKAASYQITLEEESLRILLLSTSRPKQVALWNERKKLFPDTDHNGLSALIDRRMFGEEDYIILNAADIGQFRNIDEVIKEAKGISTEARVPDFSDENARSYLENFTRREIFKEVSERTADFARCGNQEVDGWADQFRLERRTTLARALVMLSIPEERYQPPEDMVYVADLIRHFEAKVQIQIRQGPLARMIVTPKGAKIDLVELETDRMSATSLMGRLLERSGERIDFDRGLFLDDPILAQRLRKLLTQSTLFKRDTGIDSLYIGFPFAVLSLANSSAMPRIAPILLWPVKLTGHAGTNDFGLAFDSEREEVRLNPALDGYLAPVDLAKWQSAADALRHSSITIDTVLDEFGQLGTVMGDELQKLPRKDIFPQGAGVDIYTSAVLFHMAFMGQAIIENLRQLKGLPPEGTALESVLRLSEVEHSEQGVEQNELRRFFIGKIDPSQELAASAAKRAPGAVVKGPPGTGKSQVMTHIIADAIGRNETVLVCTQKQAALEVVEKRLVADGLGDRLMAVHDVNKDKNVVLRAVREQIQIVEQCSITAQRASTRRQEVAKVIETHERELNAYQDALYQDIGETGRTYRDVVAELVMLEDESPIDPISVPEIRDVVKNLSLSELAELQEHTAPLGSLWLDAKPELKGNLYLQTFGWDDGTISAYQSDLANLITREKERVACLPRVDSAFTVGDPDIAEFGLHALREHVFQSNEACADCGNWLMLFSSKRGGSFGEQTIKELLDRCKILEGFDPHAESDIFFSFVTEAKSLALKVLLENVRKRQSTSFFRFLSPVWYSAKKHVASALLKSDPSLTETPTVLDELAKAIELELVAKEPRSRILEIADALAAKIFTPPVPRLREAISRTQSLMDRLEAVQKFANSVDKAPDWSALAASLKRNDLGSYLKRVESAVERYRQTEASLMALAEFEKWVKSDVGLILKQAIVEDGKYPKQLIFLDEAKGRVAAYQQWRRVAADADASTIKVFEILRGVREKLETIEKDKIPDAIRLVLDREARLNWKAEAENQSTTLILDRSHLMSRVNKLSDLDVEMRQLNQTVLANGFNRSKIGRNGDWTSVTRFSGARALRLREFMEKAEPLGLMELRPVWLMNPDVAARLLPLKAGLFDVVVFDESSQLPVEYALHVLYRAKRVVVSGDPKQMPPSSYFSAKLSTEDDEEFDTDLDEDATEEQIEQAVRVENKRDIKDATDLLDLASTPLPEYVLQIHYRSAYRELIEFSNAAYYKRELHVPVRHPETQVKAAQPIEVVRVDGLYSNQTNESEADQLVRRLAQIWEDAGENPPSIGIITWNAKQADLINDKIEFRAERDDAFRRSLSRESNRVDEGEDMSLFCKAVEHSQGDERDWILFSTTFGRHTKDLPIRKNFGILGQSGGERRLNVAVTRAREKVIMFTSIPINEVSDFLSTRRPPNKARDYLQGYLDYAAKISDAAFAEARQGLTAFVDDNKQREEQRASEVDGFGHVVANYIRSLNWEPVSAKDSTAFSLDFAIEHPETGRFFIGIECDPPRHRLLRRARDRELWRPMVLNQGVPFIHRVSSVAWYADREKEKTRLRLAIAEAFKEAS